MKPHTKTMVPTPPYSKRKTSLFSSYVSPNAIAVGLPPLTIHMSTRDPHSWTPKTVQKCQVRGTSYAMAKNIPSARSSYHRSSSSTWLFSKEKPRPNYIETLLRLSSSPNKNPGPYYYDWDPFSLNINSTSSNFTLYQNSQSKTSPNQSLPEVYHLPLFSTSSTRFD